MEKVINRQSTLFQYDFIYEIKHFAIRLKEEILRSHRLQIPILHIEFNSHLLKNRFFENLKRQQQTQQETLTYFTQLLPELTLIGQLPSGGLGVILINTDLSFLHELNQTLNQYISETDYTASTIIDGNQSLFKAFVCSGYINRAYNPAEQLAITSIEATKVFKVHPISAYQNFAAHPKENSSLLKKMRQLFS
jgi:hypothetical protein